MYSHSVVRKSIHDLAGTLGFTPEFHTIQQVSQANRELEDLFDAENGRWRRPLRYDEQRWVENETALCQLSFAYWSTRYAFIRTWDERLVRFRPNTAQRVVNDIWSDMQDQGHAIAIQQLKARQLGISTMVELAIAHRAQFWPNVIAVVGSSDPDKSARMATMMELCWQMQPRWLVPAITKYKAGELIQFGKLNSEVSIQHGTQKSAIARGTTPTVVHLCLSPHSLVRLQDGLVKPISEVLPGDRVITSSGKIARVKHCLPSPRRNELTCELWTWGTFAPLSSTRDHPILTAEGQQPASGLREGDFVRVPVREIRDTRRMIELHRLARASNNKHPAHRSIKPDRAWGWLCGLYLAEGCLGRSKKQYGVYRTSVLFSIHEREVMRFSESLKRAVGGTPINVKRRNSKTRVLSVSDAALARWIGEEFGETDSKKIPDWVWEAGTDFCLGLVEGYLDGDGHFPASSNETYATSVRLAIPVQMRDLVASLGFGWSSISFRPAGEWYGRNCRAAWTWVCCGATGHALRSAIGKPVVDYAPAEHWRWVPDSNFIEVEVDRNYDGYSSSFYDLEVDAPEHDFLTLQCLVANSEIPDFSHPEELIDAGLLKAMHESPYMFLVLESTAKGRGNWWHNTWKVSKSGWPIGRSRLRPVFLPWFVGSDIYPTSTWLKAHPVPENYEPDKETDEHARRAEEGVSTNDLLSKYLGTDWRMPIEQKWFWEAERFEAKAKKQLAQFFSEMPATDTEAFQSTNISIFDTELVQSYRAHIRQPWGVFGIIGTGVTSRISPIESQVDRTRPRINVTARWRENSEALKYQLVPLKWNGYDSDDGWDKLYIWEPPMVNEVYGVGVDLGDGVGADQSVLEVLRKGTFTKNDALVAEFASTTMNSMDMWPVCMAVGTLYSVPYAQSLRQPRVAIECRTSGENCQLEMRKQGWKNFHQWVRYDRKRINPNSAQKIGWYTVPWSRDLLMDRMIKYIRDGAMDIFSPWFIDEMNDLERDEARQRMKIAAGDGAFDDRFMAAGIILVSLHILEFRGFRQEEAFHRIEASPLARDDSRDEYVPDYARARVM